MPKGAVKDLTKMVSVVNNTDIPLGKRIAKAEKLAYKLASSPNDAVGTNKKKAKKKAKKKVLAQLPKPLKKEVKAALKQGKKKKNK